MNPVLKPVRLVYRALKFVFSPKYRFSVMDSRGLCNSMPDEKFLRLQYECFSGRKLNLENPRTLTEKLQWLKLYDRRPEYTKMADKYEVKKLVSGKIGAEHVIPLLGVYDSFDEIDFDALPDQFVLKCTHDSGGLAVCRDKSSFDIDGARERLNASLKKNFYFRFREWVYKDIKPRIIAEQYVDSLGKPDSVEYKLTCFNGRAKLITICQGIAHSSADARTNDHYDRDMNRLMFSVYYKNPEIPAQIPAQMKDIIAFSEILSAGIPEVRVDWYMDKGRIYFGEFTFYTWAGLMKFEPPEWDEILGSWLELPEKYNG